VTAGSLANIVLLACLRYPMHLWGIGVAQLLNRLQWLMRNGRQSGILKGLSSALPLAAAHRSARDPLPASAIRSYFALRRHPVAAAWTVSR
jgi:hypothetical protein